MAAPLEEDFVDGALVSQLLAWAVAGLTALGGVLTIAAFFEMGRSSYRND